MPEGRVTKIILRQSVDISLFRDVPITHLLLIL